MKKIAFIAGMLLSLSAFSQTTYPESSDLVLAKKTRYVLVQFVF